jgi:hypothetical protein
MKLSKAKLSAVAAKKLATIEEEIARSRFTDKLGDSFSRISRPTSMVKIPVTQKGLSFANYGPLEDFQPAPIVANVYSPVGSVNNIIRNRNQMRNRTQNSSKNENPY